MWKQLSIVIFTLFASLSVSAEDEFVFAIQERVKQQFLIDIIPSLEVRDGGMCFFNPGSQSFATKVAADCMKLFETLLDDIIKGKADTLFDQSVIDGFKLPLVKKRLLEILQGNLQIIRDVTLESRSLMSEDLVAIVIETAKINHLLLGIIDKSDQGFLRSYFDLISAFVNELIILLTDFRNENSMFELGVSAWENKDFFNGLKDVPRAKLRLSLAANFGTVSDLKKEGLEFLEFFPENSDKLLNIIFKNNEDLSESSREYIEQVKWLNENCRIKENLTLSPDCESRSLSLGSNYYEYYARMYADDLITYFESIVDFSYANFSKFDHKRFFNSEIVQNVYQQKITPVLLSYNFQSLDELKNACLMYFESPCPLTIKEKSSVYSKIFISLIVSSVFFVLGYLFLVRKLKVKKSEFKFEDKSDKVLVMGADERAELRELRIFFNLSPNDGLPELHKAYRKLVFNVHPDRLKDGGREFVILQSRYLKAKLLLEKLQEEKTRKLANF